MSHPNALKDEAGKKYGRLLVLSQADTVNKHVRWNCRCDCGTLVTVRGESLRDGTSKSCGCLQRDMVRARGVAGGTHGEKRAGKCSPEYKTWTGIIGRCENRNARKWKDYGGRGIKVCSRWRNSFAAFLADMGRKSFPGASIDRINNDGDYEPGNCRWADRTTQCNNRRSSRRLTLDGKTMTVAQWGEALPSIGRLNIAARLHRGWSPERALTEPLAK